MAKNPPANAGDAGDVGSIPESRRSLEGGNGNPLQYHCLENPMDRGAWWATVHGVTKESDTAERLSMIQHTHTFCYSTITLHVNKGQGSRSLEQEVAILDWRNQGRLPGGRQHLH